MEFLTINGQWELRDTARLFTASDSWNAQDGPPGYQCSDSIRIAGDNFYVYVADDRSAALHIIISGNLSDRLIAFETYAHYLQFVSGFADYHSFENMDFSDEG